ncbi:MAG: ABC transporter permease [Thermomicrobiales bacterium]
MARYIVGRILWIVPTLFAMSLTLFLLMHATPGSPFQLEKASPAYIRNLNHQYGLDKPLPLQYLIWIGNVLHGQFGYSAVSRIHTVQSLILQQLPISLEVGFLATVLSFVVGITLGVIAAVHQNEPLDYLITLLTILGASLPSFVAAFLLLYVVIIVLPDTLHLHLGFTTLWTGTPRDYFLPVIALSIHPIATIASYTRTSMLDALHGDYVRTARAKGVREHRVIGLHVTRNALMPAITLIGPIFAGVATGSLVVEVAFDMPGIGKFFVASLLNQDYPMIMAIFLLLGTLLTVMSLICDVAYGFIDPRVRFARRS